MRSHTRRSALGIIGSTGIVALAGCLGDDDEADDGSGETGGDEFPDENERPW